MECLQKSCFELDKLSWDAKAEQVGLWDGQEPVGGKGRREPFQNSLPRLGSCFPIACRAAEGWGGEEGAKYLPLFCLLEQT